MNETKRRIRDYRVHVNSNEEAARLKKVLENNNEKIYNMSNILKGMTYIHGTKDIAGYKDGEWMYVSADSGVAIDKFEELFGEKTEVMTREELRKYCVILTSDKDVVTLKDILLSVQEPLYYSKFGGGFVDGRVEGYTRATCSDGSGWCMGGDTDQKIDLESFGKKVLQLKTEQITMKVTRQALGEIHAHVCKKWKDTIEETIEKGSAIFSNEVEVPEELVLKAWGAADKQVQKQWLVKYLPKPEPKYKAGDKVFIIRTGCEAACFSTRIYAGEVKTVQRIGACTNRDGITFTDGVYMFLDSPKEFEDNIRLATPEEVEKAQWYPDGTPCLVTQGTGDQEWFLRYANGKGEFYNNNKKEGPSSKWSRHMKLDIDNLPVNE